MSTKRLIALGTMFMVVIGVATMFATVPAPNGVIYGCYNRNTGGLRVIDMAVTSCAQNEVPITWNQTGPQGATGPQGLAGSAGATGSQGPAGPAGPAGPSHAYFVTDKSHLVPLPTFTTLLTLDVPAGAYVIDAKTALSNGTPGSLPTNVDCRLEYSIPTGGDTALVTSWPPPSGSTEFAQTSVSMNDAQTFLTNTTVIFKCAGTNLVTAYNSTLRAVLVGGIN